MHDSDIENSLKCPLDLSTVDVEASTNGILIERNHQLPGQRPSRGWIFSISASSRRRHEALLLKQRKEKLRKKRLVRRREYQRLRNMVPSIAAKPLVSKVTVIEEAIRYIDYLHEALLTRLRTKGLPSCLRDIDVDVNQLQPEDIKDLVFKFIQRKRQKKQNRRSAVPRREMRRDEDILSPFPVFQRSRNVLSYLTVDDLLRKRT